MDTDNYTGTDEYGGKNRFKHPAYDKWCKCVVRWKCSYKGHCDFHYAHKLSHLPIIKTSGDFSGAFVVSKKYYQCKSKETYAPYGDIIRVKISETPEDI